MQWVTKVPHSPQRTDLHIENFGTAKTTGKKASHRQENPYAFQSHRYRRGFMIYYYYDSIHM